jgi:hypothetical protein
MSQSQRRTFDLNKILKDLDKNKNSNEKPPLFVFDLDSTLFDVSPRLEKVLLDIAEIPEFKNRFPEVIPYFKNIKTLKNDWGFREVLKRAGIDHDHYELFETVRHYWVERFFSNEYIHYDEPYPGAVDFVNRIAKAQIPIVYLTGRDVHRMEKGSREVLKKWNFPLDDHYFKLVLKPHREMNDALFKKDWFFTLPKNEYSNYVFFENDPVNIHLIRKELPEVNIIFFDSTHSGAQKKPDDLPTIVHYLLEDEEA